MTRILIDFRYSSTAAKHQKSANNFALYSFVKSLRYELPADRFDLRKFT